jgi:hypothetical protein
VEDALCRMVPPMILVKLIKPIKPNGYFMFHRIYYQKFYTLATKFNYVLVWISKQTGFISLMTDTELDYCAVKAGCLNILQFYFSV